MLNDLSEITCITVRCLVAIVIYWLPLIAIGTVAGWLIETGLYNLLMWIIMI
jgi:hypothetical protein